MNIVNTPLGTEGQSSASMLEETRGLTPIQNRLNDINTSNNNLRRQSAIIAQNVQHVAGIEQQLDNLRLEPQIITSQSQQIKHLKKLTEFLGNLKTSIGDLEKPLIEQNATLQQLVIQQGDVFYKAAAQADKTAEKNAELEQTVKDLRDNLDSLKTTQNKTSNSIKTIQDSIVPTVQRVQRMSAELSALQKEINRLKEEQSAGHLLNIDQNLRLVRKQEEFTQNWKVLQEEVDRFRNEDLPAVRKIKEIQESLENKLLVELSENAITSVFQDSTTGEPDGSGEGAASSYQIKDLRESYSNQRFEKQPESAPEAQLGEIEAETAAEKAIPFQGKELVAAQNTEPQESSPVVQSPPHEMEPSLPDPGNFYPRLGVSLGQKFYFVRDRYEMGVAFQGEIQLTSCKFHRLNGKVLFFFDIPAHKFSIPKPNGFGTATMLGAGSVCLGKIEFERGIGGLSPARAIDKFIPNSGFRKLTEAASEFMPEDTVYRFTSVSAQPHRFIGFFYKCFFKKHGFQFLSLKSKILNDEGVRLLSPFESLFIHTKFGKYWLSKENVETQKFSYLSLVPPRNRIDLGSYRLFHGKGDFGKSLTIAFPGTDDGATLSNRLLSDERVASGDTENIKLYKLLAGLRRDLKAVETKIDVSKKDVISQFGKNTLKANELAKIAQITLKRDITAEMNKTLNNGFQEVENQIEKTAKQETLEECCASLHKNLASLEEEGIHNLDHHSPSIEKVLGIGGLLYVAPFACSLFIGVICGFIGLVMEHIFVRIQDDAHQQKIDYEQRMVLLEKALLKTEGVQTEGIQTEGVQTEGVQTEGLISTPLYLSQKEEVENLRLQLKKSQTLATVAFVLRISSSSIRMIGRALIPVIILFNLIQNKHFAEKQFLEQMYSKISFQSKALNHVIKPLLVATPNKVISVYYNVALFIIPGYTLSNLRFEDDCVLFKSKI